MSCHAAAVTAGTFYGVTPKTSSLTPAHIPMGSLGCESCHTNSIPSVLVPLSGASAGITTFGNAQFSHSGITNNCEVCHGPGITGATFFGVTKIVVMPPLGASGAGSHLPSSTKCENCHLGSTPSALVPAVATKSAPGSAFLSPAPTAAMIHSGVTGSCSSCHETNAVWMSMGQYPITTSAPFKGFQTRPQSVAGQFFVADAKHPTSGDCSNCHGGFSDFTAPSMPANHIPVSASATCVACHTNPDFAVMPSIALIHANAQSTTANCAQCHSTAAAASFAIPAAGFSIVAPPANHIPFGSTACETCHVGANSSLTLPVQNTAKFSNSAFSHAGITNNCAVCHGPTITGASFVGIKSIVVMPPFAVAGAASHIPSSTTCEVCHLGSTPSGLVAGNATKTAPGTAFKTPVPTGPMIHTGISSGCSACHEKGFVWMGVDSYPIAPKTVVAGASYTGFQTRPFASAGTYSVADAAHPATGDCSQCHNSTTAFSAAGKPTGHMPTTIATCATCHLTAGDYSYATGKLASNTILHTGISSGCIACHTAGTGAGPFAGCATQAACTAPPPITYQPKMMPLAAGAAATAPSSLTHVPVAGIACESCHSKTNFTAFSGTSMSSAAHTAVKALPCMSCHERNYKWFGVTMKTRPSAHATVTARAAPNDCDNSGCHTYSKGFLALIKPVIREAAVNATLGSLLPNLQTPAGGAVAYDHQGVEAGRCKTCHDGQHASGMPARHLMVNNSCDTCHRSTTWKPAYFNHGGIGANTCLVCHNGLGAPAKPAGHFMTARSCDSCHKTVAWQPVGYSHISPAYKPGVAAGTCVSCHITNSEIIPRQMRSSDRTKPIPVGP